MQIEELHQAQSVWKNHASAMWIFMNLPLSPITLTRQGAINGMDLAVAALFWEEQKILPHYFMDSAIRSICVSCRRSSCNSFASNSSRVKRWKPRWPASAWPNPTDPDLHQVSLNGYVISAYPQPSLRRQQSRQTSMGSHAHIHRSLLPPA